MSEETRLPIEAEQLQHAWQLLGRYRQGKANLEKRI